MLSASVFSKIMLFYRAHGYKYRRFQDHSLPNLQRIFTSISNSHFTFAT